MAAGIGEHGQAVELLFVGVFRGFERTVGKALPQNNSYGVNFGISLSIWDYLFKTAYVPNDNGNLEIGYLGDEEMPKGFISQQLFGLKRK